MNKTLLAVSICFLSFSASSYAEEESYDFNLNDTPTTYQADISNSVKFGNTVICNVPVLNDGESFDCNGDIISHSGDSASSQWVIETEILPDDLSLDEKKHQN
ncbi:hypothetical protein [uncultured Photobacterium sp.]|uniref:hypothetical protein n=1 Tax=uncultured Photobacterium sp. TaxID=173973 RepID=UPI0026128E2D|nr:hypothetical protein [uncultured Photobacterium sp.]